jgi:hypothetical protein
MNIKSELDEQLCQLKDILACARRSEDFHLAFDISKTIINFLTAMDDDSICEDCLEREAHEQMVADIAEVSDLPPELVQRVLDGRDEVLGMDD